MTTKKINYFDLNGLNYSLSEMKEIALDSINTIGYIIFRNFPVELNDLDSTRETYLDLCELVGQPISHDENNSILWDIKANDSSDSLIKTYSEHNHEAELHTDSQYSFYPEDYFGLLTVIKASCGGGLSYLLSLKEILNELKNLPGGEDIIKTLSTTDFPFIVPNVFKKDKSLKHEFNFGPILRENEIRFRVDTFEKAVKIDSTLCTDNQMMAYKALKEIIKNEDLITSLYLEPGDLIFINNKTMLHGRSQFIDNSRHLLRIRMNKL